MDNGSELTSRHFLAGESINVLNSGTFNPESRSRMPLSKAFHGRLRDECLNTQWFRNLWDARRQIAAWRTEFNQERPHSSLDYRTPYEFAQAFAAGQPLC